MKMNKDIFRLKHILQSIERIEIISEGISFEIFTTDWKIQDIVVRNLEIIGEASHHISENLKINHSQIPWNEIRGLRNIIAHEYFNIDTEQIWILIEKDILVLKKEINQILSLLENQNIDNQ